MSSPLPFPSDENYIEIPDWHREILEERMARYQEVGMEGTPWEEFRKELIEQGLFS